MSEKRLSETMSDTTHAVSEAQKTLDSAIAEAINTHFEAGIQFEQERIIKLLETYIEAYGAPEEKIVRNLFTRAIREIKGEHK